MMGKRSIAGLSAPMVWLRRAHFHESRDRRVNVGHVSRRSFSVIHLLLRRLDVRRSDLSRRLVRVENGQVVSESDDKQSANVFLAWHRFQHVVYLSPKKSLDVGQAVPARQTSIEGHDLP